MDTEQPKVFISYSWSSESHKIWVLNFAKRLTSDGVNVILDRWLLKPGNNNIDFMEIMVKDDSIKNVLVICDREYQEKADDKKGGVGIESQIISLPVYKNVNQDKFIPLVKQFIGSDACLPVFFRSRFYIDISTQEKYFNEYENILRIIFDRPEESKPEIGHPPTHIFKDKEQSQIQLKFQIFENAMLNEKKNTKGYFSNFLNQFIEEWPNYILYPFKENEKKFDEEVMNSIEKFTEYKNIFLDSIFLLTNYSSDTFYSKEVHSFFEKSLKFAFPTEKLRYFNKVWFDNFRFILFELFINTISIFLDKNRYDDYLLLTRSKYYYEETRQNKLTDFSIFSFYIQSLDYDRKWRLKSNKISIEVDVLKERVERYGKISFEKIMQSDFLLFITSIITGTSYWFPRTIMYHSYGSQPFELFLRATDKEGFENLCKLIGVSSKHQLKEKIENSEKFKQVQSSEAFIWGDLDFLRLLNFDNLFSESQV